MSLRKSLFFSFASEYSILIIQIISSLILARLLSPEEIGVFSVASMLVLLAHRLRDFGVTEYLIQEKELTTDKMRAAMGINYTTAWIICVILIFLSSEIAQFYQKEGVKDIIVVLALNFILLPFSSNVVAMLKRNMNFAAIYVIDTASTLVHAGTSITLAALGFSFMSLAWASVTSILVVSILANQYRPTSMPFLPSLRKTRAIWGFGSMTTVATLMNSAGQSAPDIIMGRVLGFEAVGYFSRANGMITLFQQMVMSAIHNVALPDFSTRYRAGEPLREYYLKATALITGLAWPFFAVVGIMAYPIIHIMFGPQWDASVPAARLLCLAAMISFLAPLWSRVYLAMGKARPYMVLQAVTQLFQIGAVFAASFFGISAVAGALIISQFLGFLLIYRKLSQLLDLSVNDYIATLTSSIVLLLLVIIIPLLVTSIMPVETNNLWLPLIEGTIGAGCFWLSGVLILNHPLKSELIKLLSIARTLLQQGMNQIIKEIGG